MFVGNHQRKLDDKGRIVLPAALRDGLERKAYVAATDGCLSIWNLDGFRSYADRLTDRVREGRDGQQVSKNFKRKLMGNSAEIGPDGQGRVTLPAALLERVGIDAAAGTEVMVIGNDDCIEIWNPEVWARIDEESEDEYVDLLRMGGI